MPPFCLHQWPRWELSLRALLHVETEICSGLWASYVLWQIHFILIFKRICRICLFCVDEQTALATDVYSILCSRCTVSTFFLLFDGFLLVWLLLLKKKKKPSLCVSKSTFLSYYIIRTISLLMYYMIRVPVCSVYCNSSSCLIQERIY